MAREPEITKAMVDAQAPVTREYFDELWRGAAAQLRREVEAQVRTQIGEALAAREADAARDYRRAADSYYEGSRDAFDIAEQIARGELKE